MSYYSKSQAIKYLKIIKYETIFMTMIFALTLIGGYVIATMYPQIAASSLEGLDQLAAMIKNLSLMQIMLIIFINNAVKSLFILVLGLIFGIAPLLFIAYNGYFLGIFSQKIIVEKGLPYLFAGLTPHGIIEIPMVILSAAIGFRLGLMTLKSIIGQKVHLKYELIEGLKFFFYWIMPLLFFAAVIETFVTSEVINLFT